MRNVRSGPILVASIQSNSLLSLTSETKIEPDLTLVSAGPQLKAQVSQTHC